MGWYSNIESAMLTRISLGIWRLFVDDLNLTEAKKTSFNSLHDCFIRELKEDARAIDRRKNIVASPCDAIVGTLGNIRETTVYQAKGYPYELRDLIPGEQLIEKYRNGKFITLRLKSTMYHRFHAPIDCRVSKINYISGDTWNVNPVALKRIEKLYCKNERAVLELQTVVPDHNILLVPVAAIMVASIRFNCLSHKLNLKYKGPNIIDCSASYKKGDEMGYFEHGSTIIVFTTDQYEIFDDINTGNRINMGQALLRRDS
jgi:phosphatidylserine decarboxylase